MTAEQRRRDLNPQPREGHLISNQAASQFASPLSLVTKTVTTPKKTSKTLGIRTWAIDFESFTGLRIDSHRLRIVSRIEKITGS